MSTVNKKSSSVKTRTIVGLGLLTAIVTVLQLIAAYMPKIGIFSLSFVLMPIVVGAALYGVWAGAWLGFVFGLIVLFTDATFPYFFAYNPVIAIALVMVKGIAAGIVSGLLYKLLSKKHPFLGIVAAAAICPIINTGVFLLGCIIFFGPVVSQLAKDFFNADSAYFIWFVIVLCNFIPELIINIILCPAIKRIIDYSKKHFKKEK